MRTKLLVALLFILHVNPLAGQSVEEVVTRYISFIGGEKGWKNVNTVITSGEYNYGGMPFPFTTYSKRPALYKLIVPFDGKFYAQGFDGSKGWKIDAFKNETTPTWMTGKEAKALANEANIELEDPFLNYTAKGHKISLVGHDTLNGRRCSIVLLQRTSGEQERYYFDTQSGELFLKQATSKNVELKNAPLNIYYSNYRTIEGIKVPLKTVCESDGQVILTITISEVSVNRPIDNKEFQPTP
jgi:hypothetical protein